MQEELDRLIVELGNGTSSISFARLYRLSDLHGEPLQRLVAALGNMPTDRRRHLLQALVELGETNVEVNFDAIYRLCLGDEDEVVRSAAIEGLWEDQNPRLINPLLRMLRSDPSPLVRAASASALGRFVLAGELEQLEAPSEARIVEELLRTWHTQDEAPEVRRRAVESMAYACVPETAAVIEAAYYEDDDALRLGAIVGMGRSCDRRWEPILLEELASDSPAMRYEAALACGELMMRKAVPALGRLLRDADRQVCYASIWALGQIGGEASRELLVDAYETADEDIAAALDEALAEQVFAEGEPDLALYDLSEDEAESWSEEEDDDLLDDDELDVSAEADEYDTPFGC